MPSKKPFAKHFLADDLDHILTHTRLLWDELKGRSIFITGGTGFFGAWLLESFLWANEKLNLKASATVLTRDPRRLKDRYPHFLKEKSLKFVKGDIRTAAFAKARFSHVIHGASEADPLEHRRDPISTVDTIILGSRKVFEFSKNCQAEKVLMISSGAVYGKQPASVKRLSEESCFGPDTTTSSSAYAEAKRLAELMGILYSSKLGFELKIARCFTFVGPYQSLDASFAVCYFIREALQKKPIRIQNAASRRSYLYAADLTIWLWTLLFRGQNGRAYNVGSEKAVDMATLADCVLKAAGTKGKIIFQNKKNSPATQYVPLTQRARLELGLRERIGLQSALEKTIAWNLR